MTRERLGRSVVVLLVTVVVVSVAGAAGTATANEPPTVDVQYSPGSPTVGETVQFTADASDPDGTVESYEWTVDGETVARGESFEHVFEESGYHYVSVTVTDDDGDTATDEVTVTVESTNEPPSVEIAAETTDPSVDEEVGFTAEASDPDGTVESYEWRVDGEPVARGESFSRTFEEPGEHEVSVTVTDDQGATSTAAVTVSVGDGPNFSVAIDSTNSPVLEGEELTVNATVRNEGPAAGSQVVTLLVGGEERDSREVSLEGGENRTITLIWETGDGDAGNYTATVTTANDTAERDVEVPESDPGQQHFDVSIDSTNAPVQEGEKMTVTATVRNHGDAADSQVVTLSVGGEERDSREVTLGGGENTTITLTWDNSGPAGDYTAQVATANDTAERDVVVKESTTGGTNDPPTIPAIGFVPCDQDCGGDPVFAAGNDSAMGQEELEIVFERDYRSKLVAPNATDPDGEVVAYDWQVDGEPAGSGESITHEFEESGEHRVTLRVTDDEGATTTVTVTVDVNARPEADVSASQSGENVPAGQPFLRNEPASFSAEASDPDGEVASYEWVIDGEVVSTSRKLDYTFEEAGEHEVTLRVTDDDGATATVTRTIEVEAASTPTDDSTTVPGFGIGAAMGALLVVVFGARRYGRRN